MNASQSKKQFAAALAALSLIGTASAEVPLPANYIPLEWIESSGSQYIDTEYKPLYSSAFEAEIEGNFTQHVGPGGWQQMGALPKTGSRYDWGISGDAKRGWTFADKDTSTQQHPEPSDFSNHVFVANFGTGSFKLDETDVQSLATSPQKADANRNFYLFARNAEYCQAADSFCYFRLRRCRLSQDGVAVRDFVPCRSIQGIAGLWDKVEGRFYASGNLNAFKGPDEAEDVFLTYLESSGSQYIDTGYMPLASNFIAEIEGNFTQHKFEKNGNNAWQQMGTLPQGGDNRWRFDWGISANASRYWTLANGESETQSDFLNHVFVIDYGKDVDSLKIGETAVVTTLPRTKDAGRNFYLFARNAEYAKGADSHCYFRMRRCRLSQDGEIVRDFVPMRSANGNLGLYDRKNDVHYPNMGSGTFAYGYAYTTNETTLLVRDGTFAADENLGGYGLIEKTGSFALKAAACLSYPADLKLSQGFFSLQDNAANSYAVNGKLTLVGGVRLAVDWVGTACDSILATSLDLSQASAESPVGLVVNADSATPDVNQPVVLLESGVSVGDEKKFVISGVSAQLEVKDGKLLMRYVDPTQPVWIPLPASYVQLDWIESSGNEWIDTEYKPLGSSSFVAEIEGNFTRQVTGYQHMGTLPEANKNAGRYDWGISAAAPHGWSFADKEAADHPSDLSNHVFVANFGTGFFMVDGTNVSTLAASPRTINSIWNFHLFARYAEYNEGPDSCCHFRLRRCQLRQDGVPVRDFVPCRSLWGVAGLWDRVEGRFYENGNPAGSFRGSDEAEDVFVAYLESSGSQYIDTEYIPLTSSSFEAEIEGNFTQHVGPGGWQQMGTLPQGGDNRWRFDWGISGNASRYWTLAQVESKTQVSDFQHHVFVVDYGTDGGSLKIGGTAVASTLGRTGNGNRNFYLFARNAEYAKGADAHCYFRLRRCRLSQGGETVRDFIPRRTADGTLCLYDRKNDVPYYNNGSGTFAYGYSYTTNGATLLVRDGTFAADEYFLGYGSIEKVTGLRLEASDCLAYPANLKLSNGIFSQQDGAANDYVVNGKLTFAGGAGWAVDWVGTACDSISATSVDLTQASAERPVVLIVNAKEATLDANCPVVLLKSGVAEDDEKKFVLSGIGAQLEVQGGQLLMRFTDATVPVRAEWTARGERGKTTDAQNWTCYDCNNAVMTNALPTDMTAVTVPPELVGSFEWREGEPLAYRRFEFPTPVTLTQDCDWRGMTMPLNGTITLNGHRLYLKSLDGSGIITDNVQPGGELTVDVSAGTLTYAGGLKMDGTLKLVKIGAGTLQGSADIAATDLTFQGGTEVRGGAFELNCSNWREIMVGQGATLKLGCDFYESMITLAGGTLQNTGNDVSHKFMQLASVRLTDDSTINVVGSFGLIGASYGPTTLDLGGHELTVNIANGKSFWFDNVDVSAGKLKVTGAGTFAINSTSLRGSEADFDLGCAKVTTAVNCDVGGWTVGASTTVSGSGTVTIHGAYRPLGDSVSNYLLADGATLDLSDRGAEFNLAAGVSFEDNATITVDLGTRKLKSGDLVVAWNDETRPENLASLRFRPAVGQGGTFAKKGTGLCYQRGMMVIIR